MNAVQRTCPTLLISAPSGPPLPRDKTIVLARKARGLSFFAAHSYGFAAVRCARFV